MLRLVLLAVALAAPSSFRSTAAAPTYRHGLRVVGASPHRLATQRAAGASHPQLRLRGGSAQAETCYPLQGEGDTDGEIVETEAEDGEIEPYSVQWVDTKVIGGADVIEQAHQEQLRKTPNKITTLIRYASFLMHVRNDPVRARELILRVHAIQPEHWWLSVHGQKYVPELPVYDFSKPPPESELRWNPSEGDAGRLPQHPGFHVQMPDLPPELLEESEEDEGADMQGWNRAAEPPASAPPASSVPAAPQYGWSAGGAEAAPGMGPGQAPAGGFGQGAAGGWCPAMPGPPPAGAGAAGFAAQGVSAMPSGSMQGFVPQQGPPQGFVPQQGTPLGFMPGASQGAMPQPGTPFPPATGAKFASAGAPPSSTGVWGGPRGPAPGAGERFNEL